MGLVFCTANRPMRTFFYSGHLHFQPLKRPMFDDVGVLDRGVHDFSCLSKGKALIKMKLQKQSIPIGKAGQPFLKQAIFFTSFPSILIFEVVSLEFGNRFERKAGFPRDHCIQAFFSKLVEDGAHRDHSNPRGKAASIFPLVLP